LHPPPKILHKRGEITFGKPLWLLDRLYEDILFD
jgi:hypothetical protein